MFHWSLSNGSGKNDVCSLESNPCKVWDYKFPLVILPTASMKKKKASVQHLRCICFGISQSSRNMGTSDLYPTKTMAALLQVKDAVHRHVARLLSWSMQCAAEGMWPSAGFCNEKLDPKSLRGKLSGQRLANGWRPVYTLWDQLIWLGIQRVSSVWTFSHWNNMLSLNQMT